MIRFWYSLLFYLLSPVIIIYLGIRAIKAQEYRQGGCERLGILPVSIEPGGILIHCASVGESIAAAPLIEALLNAYPNKVITISSSTPTGKAQVFNKFGTRVQQVFLPIDFSGATRRFIKTLDPELVILMETEVWFNLLYRCQASNIPVLLANARLSEKSLNQYLRFPNFSRQLFAMLSHVAAQYSTDSQHFLKVGVLPENLSECGNIKFDVSVSDKLLAQHNELKNQMGARPVWVAASIHPAEFDAILSTHLKLLKQFPDLLLIAVPRHPEKFELFKSKCSEHRVNFVCRSQKAIPGNDCSVWVGDTLGEMLLFCGLADLAFVGGSLFDRGGHNPLEPIVCDTPVIMGESSFNFAEITHKLLEAKIMLVVKNEAELFAQLESLFLAPEKIVTMKSHTQKFMTANRGTVKKLINRVESMFGHKSK